MTEFPAEPEGSRPAYLSLLENGELGRRVARAFQHLEDCDLCARCCHVNRRKTTRGAVCRTGQRAVLHSLGAHHGEEQPLRGRAGSGTIFFCWCNLRCIYCQNWEISQVGLGRDVEAGGIAEAMCELQSRGCHNVNFVSPSHIVPQILEAVLLAARNGFRLPLVYNTGGYDSLEALRLLDGVIDIYMPDMKYGDSDKARRYSRVRNYWEVNQAVIREMHRQVGDLVIDERGVARRGLLVRHLVLPGELADTEKVIAFLAHEISRGTYLNVMAQYRPSYRAAEYPPLNRTVTIEEYEAAKSLAARYGLERIDQRHR